MRISLKQRMKFNTRKIYGEKNGKHKIESPVNNGGEVRTDKIISQLGRQNRIIAQDANQCI